MSLPHFTNRSFSNCRAGILWDRENL